MGRYVRMVSLLLPLALPHFVQSRSLLLNGDFEVGKGGELPGWSRALYPPGTKGDVEKCVHRSRERAKSGRWSLKLDTGSVLGRELAIVFNGAVSKEALALKGRTLLLTGWVYVQPGTALRPISMRLRAFGRDERERTVFLGDVLSIKVLGEPGRWTKFEARGSLRWENVRSMDLHCAIRPDVVRTVQFLDDLRLTVYAPPALEVRPVHFSLWRDERLLPVEVTISREPKGAAVLSISLLKRPEDEPLLSWRRPPKSAVYGLSLPSGRRRPLPEGRYILRAELLDRRGRPLETDESQLELVASPWEGTLKAERGPKVRARLGEGPPEGFLVAGSTVPADLPDVLPSQPEPLSPDLDLSEGRRKGYVVFVRHYLDRLSALARPRPGELGPLRLFACPGEYEPAVLCVWAVRGALEGVRVEESDLAGVRAIIPASNVDVRAARFVKGLPPFLERRREWDIPEGRTLPLWLTFYVPPGAPPGFYEGSVVVAPKNAAPTRLTVLLRVLPLRLPPPPKGYGFWWKMDSRWNGYHSKRRDEALRHIRKQFVLLREHGFNMVSCYCMPKMSRGKGGAVEFDFTKDHWGHNAYSFEDFFRLGRETCLLSPKVPIQYPGAESLHTRWIARDLGMERSSADFDDFYREACRRIDRWAKSRGFTLAFACVDEIGNSPERRKEALRFYRLATEAGVLTSVTDNSMHIGMFLTAQPRFDEIIALRVFNFVTPEMIRNTRQAGDGLWLYNLGSGGWDGLRDRFVFGLFVENCGADGYCQWAFQWPPGRANPYEAAARGERTGYHYALPAPDGPLPTVALEGAREGIDDARYLALLPPQSRGRPLTDVPVLSTKIGEFVERWGGRWLDAVRWRAAREAMKRGRR